MVSKLSLEKLRGIVEKNDAKVTFEEADDNSYVDCEVVKGDIKLYVIFTRFRESYYAYGLNSDIAPSELYMAMRTDEPEALKKREEEIFENVTLFLNRKLIYHKNPSVFNKSRGYVELQVDGELVKIPQKKNILRLPEA